MFTRVSKRFLPLLLPVCLQGEQRINDAPGSVELMADVADMADVQARIEVYARLAPNKSPPPSKAKSPKVKVILCVICALVLNGICWV